MDKADVCCNTLIHYYLIYKHGYKECQLAVESRILIFVLVLVFFWLGVILGWFFPHNNHVYKYRELLNEIHAYILFSTFFFHFLFFDNKNFYVHVRHIDGECDLYVVWL